jgi:hypothetical protein
MLHTKQLTENIQGTPQIWGISEDQIRDAICNLKINGSLLIRRNISQYSAEFLELLGKLFFEAQSILIEPMESGFSGTGVMKVHPRFPQGGGCKVVVKYGDIQEIEQEYSNYKKYVQYYVTDGRTDVLSGPVYTDHLGGIAYTFVGTTTDDIRDFGTFYRNARIGQVQETLNFLFHKTCENWYAGLTPNHLNLVESYPYRRLKRLESDTTKKLTSVQFGKETISFKSLSDARKNTSLTNPFTLLRTEQSFACYTYQCTTHGDPNHHNIMVDEDGHTALIDFKDTGPSHVLRDVAILDSVVRFQLLYAEEATLDERWDMEQVLCHCDVKDFKQVEQLTNTFSTHNQALAKAFATVVHLRSLAEWMVDKNSKARMREYYVPSFYNALKSLNYSSLDETQREHALLSASLLATCLTSKR